MRSFFTLILIFCTLSLFSQDKQGSSFPKKNQIDSTESVPKYMEENYAKFFPKSTEGMPTMLDGVFINHTEAFASHSTLEIGTLVKVTNLENGLSTEVKIVDKLLVQSNFVIELTNSVAKKLRCDVDQIVKVRVEELKQDKLVIDEEENFF
jgi:rare lipoprotein A